MYLKMLKLNEYESQLKCNENTMIWLDNAKIIAAFAVVLLHTSNIFLMGEALGTSAWWVSNFYNSISNWCVPVFIMISGALLLEPIKQEKLTVFYQKRATKILIPMTFWSLFFLVWTTLFLGKDIGVLHSLQLISQGLPYYHMWYLYMILVMYLFTPFFRKMVASSSTNELIFFVVIILFMAAFIVIRQSFILNTHETQNYIPLIFINWFLFCIPYFFLGHLIRQSSFQPNKYVLWSVFLGSIILTAVGYYQLSLTFDLSTGIYIRHYLSVSVIPMSISIMYLLKSWNTPIISKFFTKQLAILTLGVYLIHPVVLDVILSFSLKMDLIVFIPLITLVTFKISFLLVWFIHKISYIKKII